jgi:hypothetical protein
MNLDFTDYNHPRNSPAGFGWQGEGAYQMNQSTLAWATALPRRIGRAEYIKHLQGKRLTARQRLNAACFRCSSGYNTGNDCLVSDCPLQPLNQYVLKKCTVDLSTYDDVER